MSQPPHPSSARSRSARLRACLALLIVSAAPRAFAAPPAPGSYEVELDHQGRRRFFLLHVPPQAAGGQPLPVVLNFHGGGGEPRAHEAWTGMDAVADREGFIVVYPAGFARRGEPGRALLTWNAGSCCGPAQDEGSDDVGFVRKVLIETGARLPVDATRVYATGLSNGAMMTYRLAREMSDQIAAIAPVSGASELPPPSSALPVPVLHIHSLDDPRALYIGGEGPPFPFTDRRVRHPSVEAVIRMWAAHNGCAAAATQDAPRVSRGGHTATRIAYPRCTTGMPVVLWRLTGAGHVWPGSPQKHSARLLGAATDVLDANEEIWAFFRAFRRAQAPALPASGAATSSTAAVAPPAPGERPAPELEIPFSRSSLSLRAVGATDRFTEGPSTARTGSVSLRASTTLLGNLSLGRDGPRGSGMVLGLEGRALHTGLPVVADDDRFYRLGLSLGAFHLASARRLYWVELGAFVAEQSRLLGEATPRVFALGLGTAPLTESATLIYGLGYTFDFGRGLPLPFLGLAWRWSPAWRFDLLVPVLARVTWRATDALSVMLGSAVAGDIFRYRGADAAGNQETRLLRIARLRTGLGGRYSLAPGVRLELEGGVEGASIEDGLTTRRAGGGYLRASVILGRGGAREELLAGDGG